MQGAFGARWAWVALAWVGLAGVAGPARAIEFWDERIQIHGFYETRMSFGYEDFNSGNKIDMYGWLQVLSIEAEAEIAPDGWGPFDMVAAFARVEVKYDCVWSHACGTLQSVDAFGNNPGNLPDRVQTGHRTGYAGSQKIGDDRPYWFDDRQRLSSGLYADVPAGQRAAKSFVYGSSNVGLFGASAGPDAILGDFTDIRNEQGLPGAFEYGIGVTDPTTGLPGDDDAGTYLFNRFFDCEVGNWTQKSSSAAGIGNRELIWGIDHCNKIIQPIGLHREIANPFADAASSAFGGDVNPVLLATNLDPTDPGFGLPLQPINNGAPGVPNSTALPFRPGTEFMALPHNQIDRAAGQKAWHSQGVFVPNLAMRKLLRSGDSDNPQQQFTLDELQWNRGASQETYKELREVYLEFEAFESQLWVRAGMQTIVWGKTELFRNQDQWNPVDIAIGPLSSLEESRIALWALRGIWSFYEVGPLEDVRLELVTLFDEFEPTDIGRCGEPYVPRLACTKSYGLWVHGETGTGIAGELRPANPWDNTSGTEIGARVEFRWDRFSFAVTDYYGYADTPFTPLQFEYSRNVDPNSGRPRHTQAKGECNTPLNSLTPDPDCLVPGMDPDPDDPIDNGIIANHSINQQLFAWICAGTVGVAPAVDSAACAFTLFNSTNPLNPGFPTFAHTFSAILTGSGEGIGLYSLIVGDNPTLPGPIEERFKIRFALEGAFGPGGTEVDPVLFPNGTLFATGTPLVGLDPDGGMDVALSPEQQALFGCGAFYGTDCDVQGVDLANAEASVLLQSFPWFEGTLFNSNWDTADASLPQPGTVDSIFNDGPGGGVDAVDSNGREVFPRGGIETGPAGTRYEDDNGVDDDGDGNVKDLLILPGARLDPVAMAGSIAAAASNDIEIPRWVQASLDQYDITVDGTTTVSGTPTHHPFTGQLWSSEVAVASWNLLMLTAGLGAADLGPGNVPGKGTLDRNQPLALGRCSYRQPQFCSFVSGLAAQARLTNSQVRAGGNSRFGRRNFVWASVGDLTLQYQKRNIFGFSTDFAEDTTKSSWGVEFTHVNDAIAADNSSYSGLTKLDEFNLTVSVDRPTFINFLNANRTFFINSQLFASYLQGYHRDATLRDGPLTALLLVNANTGYFQDRFLVSAAGVYDFTSQSAAFLPSVQYRFTENFSMTIGAAVLAGGWSRRDMGINQFSAQSDVTLSDSVYVENGISPARDLDNFFLRLRYTY